MSHLHPKPDLCNNRAEQYWDMVKAIVPAEKSWYKVDETDIPIRSDNAAKQIVPLSKLSSVITGLKPIRKRMVYCSPDDKTEALELVGKMEGKKR